MARLASSIILLTNSAVVAARSGGAQVFDGQIQRHVAGDIAGAVAAHTISDNGEAVFTTDSDGVFVQRAYSTGVGQAGQLKIERF